MGQALMVAVDSPVERLVDFIKSRCNELGISQRELARRADIEPGSLSNIMIGRVTKAPSVPMLEKLARGLRVDPEVLSRVLRGESPKPAELPEGERPTHGRYPVTDEEWAILRRGQAFGHRVSVDSEHPILDLPPDSRQRMGFFHRMEDVIRMAEEIRREQRHG